MFRKRLVSGVVLAGGMVGVLVADVYTAPLYVILAAVVLLGGLAAAHEVRRLLPATARPREKVLHFGVLAVLAANWYAAARPAGFHQFASSWDPVLLAFAAAVLAAFLVELWHYVGPGGNVARVANTTFTLAYVALLGSFLVKIRWLGPPADATLGAWLLAATIAVPKLGDVGAYLIGHAVGRHKFAPRLSPKKTWQGFAGGLVAGVLAALIVHELAPVFPHGPLEAVGFGLFVGLAGVLGDLAESMLKRDADVKDAAASVPGMGGVLDVIDSLLFAAPVAYCWFVFR